MTLRTQTKILLLLAFLTLTLVTGLMVFKHSEDVKASHFLRQHKLEKQQYFRELVALKGDLLKTLAFDYTYWDEMVAFLRTGNQQWARENLNTCLSSYHIDALWVYRLDGSLAYSVLKRGDRRILEQPFPLSIHQLRSDLLRKRFCHFCTTISGTVLEVRGATVHPSVDVSRQKPPRGILLVGRFWDREFLTELSRLVGGKINVNLVPGRTAAKKTGRREEYRDLEEGVITFGETLRGWDGKPLAKVTVESQSLVLRQLHRASDRDFILHCVFALLIFLLLFVSLVPWISRPLATISRSLETQDPKLIETLQRDNTEFGQIAGLMTHFFEQKENLQEEISERQQAQQALHIATTFINLPPEQIDEGIRRALGTIGEFAGADRGYVYQFTGDIQDLHQTHEWRREGIESSADQMKELHRDVFWWLLERLNHQDAIRITEGAGEDRGSAERQIAQLRKSRSVLLAPMKFRGAPIGFIGFDAVNEARNWTDQAVDLLAVSGDIFVGALERQEAEEALRESQERYALAALGANDGLWDWNLKTDEVYYSSRWKTMLGCDETQVGDSPGEWFTRVHPDDLTQLRQALESHIRGVSAHFEHEFRMLHKDGSDRWILSRGIAVRDPQGTAVRLAGSQSDITHRKQAEEQLRHNAFFDGLTDLPNRALFMDRLQHSIQQAKRNPKYQYAVLFLDLDHFKVINDGLGHTVGDQLLEAVALRLNSVLRAVDTVARMGGDEFTILLDGIEDPSQAVRVSERIERELMQPFNLPGQEVVTTTSIGIVMGQASYERAEELLRDADAAMYRAKSLGRAGYAMFDSDLHERALERLQLESEMRRAIEREEFVVYYQPIVSTASGRIVACEALVRWQHPERGLVPPGIFIPVAEETGMIIPIGTIVLRCACKQIRTWAEMGVTNVRVAVNLSARQFQFQNLTRLVLEVLEEIGVTAESLELEITESIAMQNLELTIKTLAELNGMGIELAIDDFGTGHSSFAYLKKFPIDTLKIDQSFIRGLPIDAENAAITSAIIAMTQNLQLNVRAEGVETEEQLDFLILRECPEVQGYFFSKPVGAATMTELLLGPTFPVATDARGAKLLSTGNSC